jgi:hypothetical protein
MIVLRNFIWPVSEEDFDNEIKESRETIYKASICRHPHSERAGMLLRDLPIGKALNSYSKFVDGRLILINGGPTRASDQFSFKFFSIPKAYANKINYIMLEESHRISLVIFNNKISARKALEYYLTHRSLFDPDVARVRFILKLQQAAKLLGATLPTQQSTVRHCERGGRS